MNLALHQVRNDHIQYVFNCHNRLLKFKYINRRNMDSALIEPALILKILKTNTFNIEKLPEIFDLSAAYTSSESVNVFLPDPR